MNEPLAEPFDAILELAGDPLREAMASVEQRLHEIAGIELHALYTIEAGGKRLRPLLVFVAGLGSGADTALCRAAAAVELIHSATLVHDDVLDDAPLRRGRVTIYAAAGRGAATSTGDLLFSSAFGELARNESIAQLTALSAASSALARGELMQRADAWRADVTLDRYLERCELKTARLFAAACELGALAGDGPPLAPFGRAVGLAFQILDDVLDITGPAERTGKRPGADLLDGTVTLPLILARKRSPELAALDLRDISGPDEAHRICKLIEATGAAEQARQDALELVASSKRALPDGSPQQRRALELLADGLVERFA
ncbi:MAG TPA: polyprenyl synthetase family protein [Solirubrobacteraceae bacterium]|nr:polyprenyl synthetase family protein [Solirubrobacteraceae bacterium]